MEQKLNFAAEDERSLKRWWMHTELHGAHHQQLQITKNYNTNVNRICAEEVSFQQKSL